MELIQLEPSLQHQEKSLEDNISQTRTIQLEIKPFLIDSQLSQQLIQTNTGHGCQADKTSVQLEQHMPCHLLELGDSETMSTHRHLMESDGSETMSAHRQLQDLKGSEAISTHQMTMKKRWPPENENNVDVARLLTDDKLYQQEDETSNEAILAVSSGGNMSRKQKHASQNGHFCPESDAKQDVGILYSEADSSKIFGENLPSLQPHATVYSYEEEGLKLTLETIPSNIVLYIIVNKGFFQVLHTDISAMIRMLNRMIEKKIELYFVNFLDEESDYMEVKYNLPRAVRERWVDRRRFFNMNGLKDPRTKNNNTNVQVGNDNTMEVKPKEEESNSNVQVGNGNTMEVKPKEEESNSNVQVGNGNTMEVKPKEEESNSNVQVGNGNTMEVKPKEEESNSNVQVGNGNTMEVKPKEEESNSNVQVGNGNTMEVKPKEEESNSNVQVCNGNTMEVKPKEEESNRSVQVDNDEMMEVKLEAEESNSNIQIGNDNTIEVKTKNCGRNSNVQVGNDNTMEVTTKAEESNNNAQVGNDNTMEVKTKDEESNTNAQVGNDNTIEVKPEAEESNTNAQVGTDNTMEVKTKAEESNTNAQVGNDNTIEVKPEAEESNTNAQVGTDNTMEVKTESEERNSNVQVGDNNTMEVHTATDNTSCSQIGGDLQYQYRNDSSLEGIVLTIKTPEANHRLDVTTKNHIDDNLLHINVELQDLHAQVTSTELGSVIISLKVEEGTKIGAHWMEKVIRTILSEDILSSLPVGTRMEVTCQASLSLKPLNVDIFETESDVAKSYSLLKEMTQLFSSHEDTHRVAANGSSDLMDELLKSGPGINERKWNGQTLLHKAAEAGNLGIVNSLLKKGADMTLKDYDNFTPLHLSARAGKYKCIEVLMKFGRFEKLETIEIPKPDLSKPTNYRMIEVLLAAGADINVRDHDLNTALHFAASSGNLQILNLLLKYNPDVRCLNREGYTALHLAVAKRNYEYGVQLAKYDQDALHIADKRGNTPLHARVLCIMPISVSETILKIPFPYLERGETPLHLAAKNGHIDSVYILLKLGADVNETNAKGRTALHEIVRSQITCENENILYDDLNARHFIQLYRRKGLNTQNNNGDSPVVTAVFRRLWKFAEDLINAGADVNVPNNRGETVLHALARTTEEESPSDLIKTVLAHGGNCNAKDKEGNTPLHLAVERNNQLISKHLLDARADPDAKNNDGVKANDKESNTPLELAEKWKNQFILKQLLDASADPDF